jgi:hypothetical protein
VDRFEVLRKLDEFEQPLREDPPHHMGRIRVQLEPVRPATPWGVHLVRVRPDVPRRHPHELAELRRILSGARPPSARGYLVLHRGCRSGSDEVAHRTVRP